MSARRRCRCGWRLHRDVLATQRSRWGSTQLTSTDRSAMALRRLPLPSFTWRLARPGPLVTAPTQRHGVGLALPFLHILLAQSHPIGASHSMRSASGMQLRLQAHSPRVALLPSSSSAHLRAPLVGSHVGSFHRPPTRSLSHWAAAGSAAAACCRHANTSTQHHQFSPVVGWVDAGGWRCRHLRCAGLPAHCRGCNSADRGQVLTC
jgi:hypothetical protein